MKKMVGLEYRKRINWRFALIIACAIVGCVTGKVRAQSTCAKLADLPAAPELVGLPAPY